MSRTSIPLFLLAAFTACADAGPTALDSSPRATKPSAGPRLSVTDPCAGDRASSASEIVYPSAEHRTLQSAVCAVAAGGTIHVLAGTYDERVTIWGKYVRIRGAGNDEEPAEWPVLRAAVPSEVVAARSATGVFSVGGGGSLSLTMLRVSGGDAGILVDETSGPVDVKHARFEDNGRGILHFASAALSIKHTTFTGQLWNAISFVPFDLTAQNCGGLDVSHSVLGSTGNAGIYVRGCLHTIEHTAIDHAQGGGIVAIASVVTVRQVRITFARYFGIFLINTAAHVEDTSIDFTKAGPLAPDPDPVYGDAISLWTTNASWAQGGPKPAYALLKNNTTTFTARVAFSVFGGNADLKNNIFSFQAIDIQVETFDGYVAALTDLGGNQCFPSSGPGNPCEALSIGVPTPPNMGGLE
jgi:hypothetical protein